MAAVACLLLVLLILVARRLVRSAGRCECRKFPQEKALPVVPINVVPINVVHSYDEETVAAVSFTNDKMLALPRYV